MKAMLLGAEHNPDLVALARIPLGGKPSVSYRREPDYFAGLEPVGEGTDVVGVYDGNVLTGACTRSWKRVWLDGRVTRVGYLGGLRLPPECQRRMYLPAGYRLLREIDKDKPGCLYLCTFLSRGSNSMQIMTRPRPGLLRFHSWGELPCILPPCAPAFISSPVPRRPPRAPGGSSRAPGVSQLGRPQETVLSGSRGTRLHRRHLAFAQWVSLVSLGSRRKDPGRGCSLGPDSLPAGCRRGIPAVPPADPATGKRLPAPDREAESSERGRAAGAAVSRLRNGGRQRSLGAGPGRSGRPRRSRRNRRPASLDRFC